MLFQKHHMTGLTGLMSAHCSATAPMHRFRGPFQDNHIWPCTWIRVVESEVLPALPPRTEGFSTPLCFHQPCLVSLLKSLRSIIVPTDSSESLWGETSRWNKEKRTHLYPAVHRGVEEPQWVIQHDNRNPLHCSLVSPQQMKGSKVSRFKRNGYTRASKFISSPPPSVRSVQTLSLLHRQRTHFIWKKRFKKFMKQENINEMIMWGSR